MDQEREEGEFAGLDEAGDRLEREMEGIHSRADRMAESAEKGRLSDVPVTHSDDHDAKLKEIEAAARRARKSSGIKSREQIEGERRVPRSVTGREIHSDYSGFRKGFLMMAMIVGGLVLGLAIGHFVGLRTGNTGASGIGALIGFIVGFALFFLAARRLEDD